jgi:hypothetical protein
MSAISRDGRAIVEAVNRVSTQVGRLVDALTTGTDAPTTTADDGPTPDFTSPIAGRIEVRLPCPYCGDRQMIPTHQFDEHVARLHPDVKTGGPGIPVPDAGAHRRAEEYEQERDQAIAVLAEVLRLFTPALVNGKYAFYQAEQPVPVEEFGRWRSVVQHDVERPWWQQLDEVRAELEQAQAAVERVRKALDDRPPILNAEGQGVSDYETGWRDHDRVVRAALDGTEQPTTEA